MAQVATGDMVRALGMMRRAGVRFYPVRALRRECGCRTVVGWDTHKLEPFAGFQPCSEHEEAAARAKARYFDPDVMERFNNAEAIDSMMELLEEAIAEE